MRRRMRSACSAMRRKYARISGRCIAGAASSRVAAEPLTELSGARSSWLTMPRNAASLAFHLPQRREVLHRDHHRDHRAVLGVDGRRVDQHGDAAPIGNRQLNLLGAHRLGAAQHAREGKLGERERAPVGEAAGHDTEEVLGGAPRCAQALGDAPRLAVERGEVAGRGVEHGHPDRRGLDQGFEVGTRAALVAVGARMGDGGRGLGCEQHQHLFVPVGERRPVLLLDEVEVADVHAAVAHRRALEGLRRQPLGGEAERVDVGGHVGDAKRPLEVAEEGEELRPVGPLRHRCGAPPR